jgi:alpha-1,2-mannosyltransferase
MRRQLLRATGLVGASPKRQVTLAAALAAATVGFLAAVQYWRGFFDLIVYYGAIHYWAAGGDLYDYVLPGTEYGFTYPPFAALVMLPMNLVNWPVTVAATVLLGVGSLALLTYWLVEPIARRHGWTPWFAVVAAVCALAILEPVYDTLSFGQVNLVLVVLVFGDARLLVKGSPLAGIGIGLATAVKLTPGLFIVYLLLARRWTAAGVAALTAGTATMLAGLIAPDASRIFWTDALWQPDRIGSVGYISNQSVLGMLTRLHPIGPDWPVLLTWLLAVTGALAVWAYRVRRPAAMHDHLTGFALTGVAACLVSPVTWVHHLVWGVPALVLVAEHGLLAARGSLRRRRLLAGAGVAYVLLCSSLVFLWRFDGSGIDGLLGGSAYLWIAVALLLGVPTALRPPVVVLSPAAPAAPSGASSVGGGSRSRTASTYASGSG